jgi:hypothetical protein
MIPLMESWAGKKRSRTDEDPKDLQLKRRGSTFTASSSQHPSPLPSRADHHFYDPYFLDQRRLPPLYGPLYSTSAEPLVASASQYPPPSRETAFPNEPKPRSQSLFNIFQYPHWRASQPNQGMKNAILSSLGRIGGIEA